MFELDALFVVKQSDFEYWSWGCDILYWYSLRDTKRLPGCRNHGFVATSTMRCGIDGELKSMMLCCCLTVLAVGCVNVLLYQFVNAAPIRFNLIEVSFLACA